MTAILNALVLRLPARVRPYAKAFVPAVGTLLAVGVQYVVTGELDRAELTTALTGAGTTLVTLLTPNHPG